MDGGLRNLTAVALLVLSAMGLEAQQPRRVIIDTDAGADDLLAILFLLHRPDVTIEAVTIVHGLAHPKDGAETVSRLLECEGRQDIPVFIGAVGPLEGSASFPPQWRTAADGLLRSYMDPPSKGPQKETAAKFLARRLRADPPVDVLALGPLTNLALALRGEPRLGRSLRELVWMGGALEVSGNVPSDPGSEWNAFLDPLAVQAILRAEWKVRIIGLDASNRVPILPANLEGLTGLAADILHLEADSIAKGRYFAWDPLAAVALVEPGVVRMRHATLGVRRRSPERGRLLPVPGFRPNAAVAVSADAGLFHSLFWSTLLRTSKR